MRGLLRNLNGSGAVRLIECARTTVLDGSGLRVLRLFPLADNPGIRECGGNEGGGATE
jgi:hypothetical protein